jgi:hypothetical protein
VEGNQVTNTFTQEQINENAIAFSFKQGEGYKYIGAPRPKMPADAEASVCEPAPQTPDDTWHKLHPFGQLENFTYSMRWNAVKKWWHASQEAGGRRIAFTSEYLASHGWTYVEPE